MEPFLDVKINHPGDVLCRGVQGFEILQLVQGVVVKTLYERMKNFFHLVEIHQHPLGVQFLSHKAYLGLPAVAVGPGADAGIIP